VVRGARIANAAGAGYDLTQRGPALFMLDATPAAGKTVDDAERAMRAEIARIAKEGVPAQELERVKTQYVAAQVYKRDSVFAQAMELAQLEITGFSHRDDAMTVATLAPQPVGDKPAAPPAGLRH
jgi:zinc protease